MNYRHMLAEENYKIKVKTSFYSRGEITNFHPRYTGFEKSLVKCLEFCLIHLHIECV
jgi:hypothetical protein